ncbi:MAG: transcriptional regulator [Acidobacteria bacterium]|nr:MAG: transcriptional regulator [Acidobacteriota bacterium]
MPSICRFFGIVIYIYCDDHAPPHFHAKYSGQEALYEIDTLRLYRGRLPPRAHSLVLEWADMHRNELRDNWRRAQRHQTLHSIEPLY